MEETMADQNICVIDLIEKMADHMPISLPSMRTAGDIMTTDVRTLTLDHTAEAFCRFMKTYHVRHAPVVDYPFGDKSAPEFIGIVSERDVLRLGLPQTEEVDPIEIDPRAKRQLLTQIITRKPKSVSATDAIPDVIETMQRNQVDLVPVLDETGLVGIITTTDILELTVKLSEACKRLFNASDTNLPLKDLGQLHADATRVFDSFAGTIAGNVMTPDVISLRSDDVLGSAKDILQQQRFRHMPIVDKQAELVGILSDRDILRHLPFAGRRPPRDTGEFRHHLFEVTESSMSLMIPLNRIMTCDVSCVLAEAALSDVARMMQNQKMSCLPVVEANRKLCGIITGVDIMRSLLPLYETSELSLSLEGAGDLESIEAQDV
jgi:CBS domain-containing membrane protein